MDPKPIIYVKTSITEGPVERGYAAWKTAKIERGLAQARDRYSLISAEQMLRDFGLER